MNIVSNWLSDQLHLSANVQVKLLYTLVAILIMLVLRMSLNYFINKHTSDPKDKYTYHHTSKYILNGTLIVVVAVIWITEVRSLATFFGLISAALTIALKDAVVNIAGWGFIIVRKPFVVGDRISIAGHQGDVIDIRLYQFTLNEIGNWVDADQSTGRIIHIPNGKVFVEPQANFTQGFSHIWNEIGVVVTFESDWKKAKGILEEIVTRHAAHFTKNAEQRLVEASRKFMILYSKLTPIVYTSVKDHGVLLTMRYLITPRRRRGSEQEIWEDVLEEFAKHKDIDFAYPTQRLFYHLTEGKNSGDSTSLP